ncbi:helix-turn-helix domain-containing protein [Undibacterium terreum]|uniref:Transcriptional regulator n=1 Tax=Undibacterium terreum TaxID=1224302 RepID=A0A916UQF9_9BURK|nr:transcriptional regulator [Undibacterium terreum]GGC83274.1 transcriptional regulator [Undibacterium terreum]
MEHSAIEQITIRFQALASLVPLRPIRTKNDYVNAVVFINQLLDTGAANEFSPLADLTNVLGLLVADYESAQNSVPAIAPVELLRFLMEQHHLAQSDMPEIGSEDEVSDILCGKQQLDTRQIKLLAGRFKVPVSIFI